MGMREMAVKPRVGRIYRIRCDNGLTYVGQTELSLSERLTGHLAFPTNSRMKEALNSSATIELLYEFNFVEDAVIREVEKDYIEKELKEVGDVLNVQHAPRVVVSDKKAVSIRQPKFKIADDEGSKRFEVLCRAKAVDKSDQVARFSYAKRDKGVASEEALEWQRTMLAKYF
jgi:predicted GIY-YIG superfamily endonuclease